MDAFSNKAKWHFWHFGGNGWLPDQQNNVRIALITFQPTTPIKRLVLLPVDVQSLLIISCLVYYLPSSSAVLTSFKLLLLVISAEKSVI